MMQCGKDRHAHVSCQNTGAMMVFQAMMNQGTRGGFAIAACDTDFLNMGKQDMKQLNVTHDGSVVFQRVLHNGVIRNTG